MGSVALLGNSDLVIYNFRRELVERLVSEGHQVILLIPEAVHKEYFDALGCIVYETPIDRRGTNPFKDYGLYRLYLKLLANIRPDIIYTYTIKCSVYGGMAAAKLGIPQIANVTGLGSATTGNPLIRVISEYMYKKGIHDSVCTFFQNKQNEEYCLKKGIKGKKYRLIPGSGVNLEQFKSLPFPKTGNINFLFVSRIMHEKGIDEYITAAKVIKSKYPNTNFLVIGRCEEDYEDTLHTLENEGIIKYYGMQDDVRPFLRESHCLVHPSFYAEGLSNVCLEAAATGRVVITTDNPGCRETVDDGVSGYVVPMKDTGALVEAIEKFLGLPFEEKRLMGVAGRAKTEREFDRQIVVEAYMEESSKYIEIKTESSDIAK